MDFAENLKQLRKDKHLSQEELAEILDVRRQAVSKWEQGIGYPEVEKLLLLSGKMHGGKSSPQYALFGVNHGISLWGDEPTTFLGWYEDKDQITKEISEIYNAIVNGTATYVLKYSAKTERKWMKIKIIE